MDKTKILILLLFMFSVLACKSSKDGQNKDIVVSFWESEDSVIAPYLDSIIIDFEKENPGVKVTRTHYSVEDLHTQFQSASIADSSPDILLTASDKAGLFVASGLIAPLDRVIDLSQYVRSAVEATAEDGRIWGVPNNYGNQLMLYYNTDHVKTPPATTNELFKICDSLIKKGVSCLELNQTEPFWLIPVLSSFGGWPIKGHEPELDNTAMIESLEFLKELRSKKYVSQECDYNCMDSMFKEGKAAMIINGDWTVGAYIESMKGKMRLAVLPINSATGKRMSPMVSGKYFFVSSSVKPDKMVTVKKLIETFNSYKNQLRMQKELKKLPALRAIFYGPDIKNDEIYSVMAKQIEYGRAMPSVVEMRAVWDVMRQYQGLVMSNRMDSVTAARRMQEEVAKRILEMKM